MHSVQFQLAVIVFELSQLIPSGWTWKPEKLVVFVNVRRSRSHVRFWCQIFKECLIPNLQSFRFLICLDRSIWTTSTGASLQSRSDFFITYSTFYVMTFIKCDKTSFWKCPQFPVFSPPLLYRSSEPILRQPDTRPESLTHHLSLNYKLCQWVSPGPLSSLIREVMGHCSCWPGLRERNCKPRLP